MRTTILPPALSGLALALAIQSLNAMEAIRPVPGLPISFESYLSRAGQHNLGYLADSLNVSMAEAEITAASVLPDPSLDFEVGHDTYTFGISYSLELGKRHARVEFAESQAELERITLGQAFQELRSEA
ncbi:MAG: TolC family protein, partial [Muribaculaceae bacterium]|nr:TolC family protein [Muribaculaceae bacterium]